MKINICVSIIFGIYALLCFDSTNAAVGRSGPNPLRKEGGCYNDNTGHMTAGENKTVSGQCMEATCSSDGSTSFVTCVAYPPDLKCLSKLDLSKKYPECCPKIIC